MLTSKPHRLALTPLSPRSVPCARVCTLAVGQRARQLALLPQAAALLLPARQRLPAPTRTARRRVTATASSVPPPPPPPPPPASVWETKPPWCQPWTIVLTGSGIVVGSHAVLGALHWWEALTVLPAAVIAAWWYLFLVLYPASWRESVEEARRRGADWRSEQ